MSEYNALFDQHVWSYPPPPQSTPFPPYPTDQLGLLDQHPPNSAWTNSTTSSTQLSHQSPIGDPNHWFTNNQSPQQPPDQSKLHSPIIPYLTPLNQHQHQHQQNPDASSAMRTFASRSSFDNTNPAPSPQQLNSPPPPPGVHSFLNGFTSSTAYPPPVSQEDYLRLLKQTQPQHQHQSQTSSIFPSSAPSPSTSTRPDSSSSTHSTVNPYNNSSQQQPPQPLASTSSSSAHQTFSLPPPAQYHSSRQHERTPSTNSSIRTSSGDRNPTSPARNSYPTYPSPQHHLPFPIPIHPAPDGEYNPSEPYIPLTHPTHPHYHQFLAQQQHAQQINSFSSQQQPPQTQTQQQTQLPNSLGFCPPAPGPLLQFSAPTTGTNSSVGMMGLGGNLGGQDQVGATGGGTGEENKVSLDGKGKGKGKANVNENGGFVKPRESGPGRTGSISSSTGGGGGRKRSFSATSPPDRTQNEGSEDPEEDDLIGGSGGSGGGFGQQAQASTSSAQPRGGGAPTGAPTSIILPNSIDPITGYPRRQTEVPAVEDDPSVRPYGCNYCFLSRTQDAPTRSYWASRGGKLEENEMIGWRTVKELREHSAREHRDRQESMREYELECQENPELEKNGKGPEQPFRCALEPCGKTFKSLAGLRFHFQNASANGHFLVTMEKDTKTGEERPTKKFKSDVQPTGRELSCPVDRCPKRFKQSAGLAYHLSHTPNHPITEAELSTYEATLQSKTRWWFKKLGLQFAQP